MRVDVWLDVACLFRTRSEAQRACRGGKVDVNGESARPNRIVRAGDVKDSQADISKAKALLGYEPIVDLEEGLRHTLAWCQGERTAAARR